MRVYLSHPYGGKAENMVHAARIAQWYRTAWKHEGKDYELVDPFEELKYARGKNTEDQMLGLAVELMRGCDAVIFSDGWKKSRGCRYEHMVAFAEGKKIGYIPPEFCALFNDVREAVA